MTICNRIDEVRDFVLNELDVAARPAVKKHLQECAECAAEADQLQLTTAALRILPDREIPQRIAFVSDKVFEPKQSWLGAVWNSGPRLGFASACVLAVGLVAYGYRPIPTAQPQAVQQTASLSATEITKQVDTAVSRAVAEVRAEDVKLTRAALAEADVRHEREHQALMVSMEENLTVLQKRYSTLTMLASSDAARYGAGQ